MESLALSILRSIYRSQPITRRALCDQTGLNINRVSALVSQLVMRQLVHEETPQNGTPGRPAALLSLNPGAGRAVGLDIGGTHSCAILSDLNGRMLASVIHPTQVVPDRVVILENITRLVEAVCQKGGVQPTSLTTLGVGLQGIVNTQTGVVLDWPNTPEWADGWKGLNVPEELIKRLGVEPVLVNDSVRAMGTTAHRFGPARGSANSLYLFLGSGIGAGIFVDGRPYQGSCGMAGELGHVVVDEGGPWCSCGNRGCLEVMASTTAVMRRVQKRLAESPLMSMLREAYERNELTLAALIEAAHAGDKLAFQILDETGAYVGKVLAIALNVVDPGLVLLGGPLAQDGDIILDAVQRQVRLYALQHISKHTRIVYDDQGELAGARGAALLALDALFSSQVYLERLIEQVGV